MTIEKVERIPKRKELEKKSPSEVTQMLDDIMYMNVKYGKITIMDDEYSSIYSARGALRNASNTRGYPLKFTVRNGELYFVRSDM